MQEEEQGWSFSDNQICSRCISDPYLKGFIENSATDAPCNFCGRRPSIPLNDVMETGVRCPVHGGVARNIRSSGSGDRIQFQYEACCDDLKQAIAAKLR